MSTNSILFTPASLRLSMFTSRMHSGQPVHHVQAFQSYTEPRVSFQATLTFTCLSKSLGSVFTSIVEHFDLPVLALSCILGGLETLP